MAPPQGDATQLLIAWSNGDQAALDKPMPLLERAAELVALDPSPPG